MVPAGSTFCLTADPTPKLCPSLMPVLKLRVCCRHWRPAATRWPSVWRAWCAARMSSRSWHAACDAL